MTATLERSVVSKESLASVATTAIQTMLKREGKEWLPSTAHEALLELLRSDGKAVKGTASMTWGDGYSEGMEFGLAVAAIVMSHGFDNSAIAQAIREELDSGFWPDDDDWKKPEHG